MKCSKQCMYACNKGTKVLGMIKRTIRFKDMRVILSLYKTLVRPQVEYCISADNPHYKKDKKLIEKVQRRFTKIINNMEGKSYEDSRDVNSREIAFPGRESQFPGLDFTQVRTFTCVIGVGSPAGARRGRGDHRPDPAPFPADDGTPSPPADDQHSRQWCTQNGQGGGYGDRDRGSTTAIGPRMTGRGITAYTPSDTAGQSVDVAGRMGA